MSPIVARFRLQCSRCGALALPGATKRRAKELARQEGWLIYWMQHGWNPREWRVVECPICAGSVV